MATATFTVSGTFDPASLLARERRYTRLLVRYAAQEAARVIRSGLRQKMLRIWREHTPRRTGTLRRSERIHVRQGRRTARSSSVVIRYRVLPPGSEYFHAVARRNPAIRRAKVARAVFAQARPQVVETALERARERAARAVGRRA